MLQSSVHGRSWLKELNNPAKGYQFTPPIISLSVIKLQSPYCYESAMHKASLKRWLLSKHIIKHQLSSAVGTVSVPQMADLLPEHLRLLCLPLYSIGVDSETINLIWSKLAETKSIGVFCLNASLLMPSTEIYGCRCLPAGPS